MTRILDERDRKEIEQQAESNKEQLEQLIDSVNKELSEDIQELAEDTAERIENLDVKMSDRIDTVNDLLTDKIDDVNTVLNDRIDSVNIALNESIDDIVNRLDLDLYASLTTINGTYLNQSSMVKDITINLLLNPNATLIQIGRAGYPSAYMAGYTFMGWKLATSGSGSSA